MSNLQADPTPAPEFYPAPHPFRLDTIPGIDPGPLPSHVPGLPDPDEEPEFDPEPDADPDPELPPGPETPGPDPGFLDPFPFPSPLVT